MSSLHEEFRAKQKDIKLTTVHPYFINTRPDLIKGWHHRSANPVPPRLLPSCSCLRHLMLISFCHMPCITLIPFILY